MTARDTSTKHSNNYGPEWRDHVPLWKDQIGMIWVGDLLHIENARLKRFREELQVRVDRLAKARFRVQGKGCL